MTDKEKKTAAKKFADYWRDKGDEKSDTQSFWFMLLREIFGVQEPEKVFEFEKRVKDETTNFIDCYMDSTKVMIEQKTLGKDLRKGIKQSDGSVLSPFQQAKRYITNLPVSKHPRWLITCNFSEFLIYDMEKPNCEPEQIFLKDLPKEYYRLQFLVDTGNTDFQKEMQISIDAGKITEKLYNSLIQQYKNPDSVESLKSLNMLCVRLVFCFYAENSDIFTHNQFKNYMRDIPVDKWHRELKNLFNILNTNPEKRDPYDDEKLNAFPYVNGGLFADENIEIPRFTEEIKDIIINQACGFDWRNISPTIFGAVFESTLNPETRRLGGMHYTSIENIHKVIDPLFLDDLKAELSGILEIKVIKTRLARLDEFRNKLAALTFLDPACGSGNFLTETYISLRRLENEALRAIYGGQKLFSIDDDLIRVGIHQFYGIEINDFAVTVAKTALWIAESQMMQETEAIVEHDLDFLPLKSYANIVEGNSLRIDWESVVPKDKLSYIMGNPPFVGQSLRSESQSLDMIMIFDEGTPETKLDYVLCWYKKSLDLMNSVKQGSIISAFVSTNSICQGESVPTFWKRMFDNGVEICFAHKSFKWISESINNAMVSCVIIGFTNGNYNKQKVIYDNERKLKVKHINAYLHSAPDVWIVSRKNIPPDGMGKMTKGSEPTDGRGNLFLTSEEKSALELKYPSLKKYIRPFIGGDEYVNNKQGTYSRYCLWFENTNPADYANIKEINQRLHNVAEARRKSSASRIKNMADYPYLFCQIRQPHSEYLIFPRHTSSNRKYIPIGYMNENIIVGDACYILADTPVYIFGILTSNIHMAWTKLVCGKLGDSAYRYTPAIYNNFPFPNLTSEKKANIERTAQAILDARKLYPESSLADLYKDIIMPPELRKAHQANDLAVMEAYGFDKKITESECVTELMKLYQKLTK